MPNPENNETKPATTEAKTESAEPKTESAEPIVFFEEEEDFNEFYEKTLVGIKEQDIVQATISEIGKDFIIVDIGYKADCRIPADEFQNTEGYAFFTSTVFLNPFATQGL